MLDVWRYINFEYSYGVSSNIYIFVCVCVSEWVSEWVCVYMCVCVDVDNINLSEVS